MMPAIRRGGGEPTSCSPYHLHSSEVPDFARQLVSVDLVTAEWCANPYCRC